MIESTVGNEHISNEEYIYPFENNKFMIGVNLDGNYNSFSSCSIQQVKLYMYAYKMKYNETTRTETPTSEEHYVTQWNITHFPTINDYKNLKGNFLWPTSDFRLKGSRISHANENFSFALKFNPNSSCNQSFQEFLEDVNYFRLKVLLLNEILDPLNFENPIQGILNDQNYQVIDPKQITFNTLLIQK